MNTALHVRMVNTQSLTIAHYVSIAIVALGIVELLPLLCILVYPNQQAYAPHFILPGLIAMVVGYLLYFASKQTLSNTGYNQTVPLNSKGAATCTLMVWLIGIALYAAPFTLSELLNPYQAIFEATSGLTTTGLSVIDVDACPRIFLLFRSFMQYLGGVGLVLVLTSIVNHAGSLKVYNIEGHTDRLLPSTAKTARAILIMYTVIICLGAAAYRVAGMPWFDAVCTAMSAVSTGGFSVHSESIAYYHSVAIEAITMVLMILGATNFLLLFMLAKGKIKAFFLHIETSVFYAIVIIASVSIALLMWFGFCLGAKTSFLDTLWSALFQVISVFTSCGFQTITSFSILSSSVLLILIALMTIGSFAGSTAGGIKIYRVCVAAKGLIWDLQERFGNKRHVSSKKINRFGRKIVCTEEQRNEAKSYIVIFMFIFMIGTFLFTLCGATLEEALFDFMSCLGNTGVGVGYLSSNSKAPELLIGATAMLLGRLEIIPVFVGLSALVPTKKKG